MGVCASSQRNSTNSETMITGKGIIMVESISAKSAPRPRKRRRANA